MRIRAALVIAAAAAAAFLPAQSASAVCIPAWQAVTNGDCNPCTTVDQVTRTLHDKFGTPESVTACLT